MIHSDRFPIRLYKSIALLALMVLCQVMWADTLVAAAPGDAASNAEGLLEQGEKSLLEGQYADAREYFARAASLDPHDPRSRVSLGFSEFALGDFENAATTVHEVMKMAPDLAATPLDMRGFFGEIDIIEKQLAKLEQITQHHAKNSRMNFLLGFVRYYSGDHASGAQTLLEYIAANPEDSSIRSFIEIAGSVAQPMPQPDERSIAQQSGRPPSGEPVDAPRTANARSPTCAPLNPAKSFRLRAKGIHITRNLRFPVPRILGARPPSLSRTAQIQTWCSPRLP
jgi:tetratricopeptide (TPR) repeat protein